MSVVHVGRRTVQGLLGPTRLTSMCHGTDTAHHERIATVALPPGSSVGPRFTSTHADCCPSGLPGTNVYKRTVRFPRGKYPGAVRCATTTGCADSSCTACGFVQTSAPFVYITFQNGTGGASTLNGLTVPLPFDLSAGFPRWNLLSPVTIHSGCVVDVHSFANLNLATEVSCQLGVLAGLAGFTTVPPVVPGDCSAAGPWVFPTPYNCAGPVVSTAVAVPILRANFFNFCDCTPALIGETVDIVLSI